MTKIDTATEIDVRISHVVKYRIVGIGALRLARSITCVSLLTSDRDCWLYVQMLRDRNVVFCRYMTSPYVARSYKLSIHGDS